MFVIRTKAGRWRMKRFNSYISLHVRIWMIIILSRKPLSYKKCNITLHLKKKKKSTVLTRQSIMPIACDRKQPPAKRNCRKTMSFETGIILARRQISVRERNDVHIYLWRKSFDARTIFAYQNLNAPKLYRFQPSIKNFPCKKPFLSSEANGVYLKDAHVLRKHMCVLKY